MKNAMPVIQEKFKPIEKVQADFMEDFREMKTRLAKLEEEMETLKRSKNGYFKLT